MQTQPASPSRAYADAQNQRLVSPLVADSGSSWGRFPGNAFEITLKGLCQEIGNHQCFQEGPSTHSRALTSGNRSDSSKKTDVHDLGTGQIFRLTVDRWSHRHRANLDISPVPNGRRNSAFVFVRFPSFFQGIEGVGRQSGTGPLGGEVSSSGHGRESSDGRRLVDWLLAER
jgi:hypothetical protein